MCFVLVYYRCTLYVCSVCWVLYTPQKTSFDIGSFQKENSDPIISHLVAFTKKSMVDSHPEKCIFWFFCFYQFRYCAEEENKNAGNQLFLLQGTYSEDSFNPSFSQNPIIAWEILELFLLENTEPPLLINYSLTKFLKYLKKNSLTRNSEAIDLLSPSVNYSHIEHLFQIGIHHSIHPILIINPNTCFYLAQKKSETRCGEV